LGKVKKPKFGKVKFQKNSAKHHAAGFLRHDVVSSRYSRKTDHKDKPNMYIRRSAGQKKDILNKESVGKEFNKKDMIYTTSSSHTYLMKDMLIHQKQQKQLW
jgi:hypothetical protein